MHDAAQNTAGDWKEYSGNPILAPGNRSEWDQWAVMSMTAVKMRESFHLYYEGGATGCGDLRIGHATSRDGLHWTKDPANPVLDKGKPGEWDDEATWDPFVIFEDGIFKMWYGGQSVGGGKLAGYQCGYATSRDGVHFVKHGKISNFAHGEMADMHVVHDRKSGRYFMYYWDRNFKLPQKLRLARSPNETDFDFDRSLSVSIEGEVPGHRYTHVWQEGDKWYMLYGFENKGRTGYATSPNGLHWAAENKNLISTEDAEMLKVAPGRYFLFYCPAGFQDKAGCDIRLAIYNGRLDDLTGQRK